MIQSFRKRIKKGIWMLKINKDFNKYVEKVLRQEFDAEFRRLPQSRLHYHAYALCLEKAVDVT